MKKHLLFFIFSLWFQISIGQVVGEWVWLKGSNNANASANWGTQGVPSPSNNPPALYEPCEWTDLSGNFWMFGGIGSFNPDRVYAALWKYNPVTNEWTWMKGPNDTLCNPGSWGIQGVSSPTNYPPTSIFVAASWVDNTGDLWMFQGGGCLPNWGGVDWNALWRYHIATNEWTWMKGTDTINDQGVWGIMGVPDTANYPRNRDECAATWVDNQNNLWMFGGTGRNDLWRYNIPTNTWTWMKGTQAWNSAGVYSTIGIEDSLNTPGARGCYSRWIDNNGNLWLFGGSVYNSLDSYNDLWRYNVSTNNWTWMKGSNGINGLPFYSNLCTYSVLNVPRSLYETRACWKDVSGNFWFFGGAHNFDVYNDLWKYCLQSNEWVLMSGNGTANPSGFWGTQGISSPLNHPNGRYGSVSWSDNNNHLYFYGGGSTPGNGQYNDLWMFTVDNKCAPCPSITEVENISPQQTSINIFPNPFTNELIFNSESEEQSEIIIYDFTSRKLLQQKFTNSVSLNTEQLAKGLYLYEVRNKNGLCKKGKVVKD